MEFEKFKIVSFNEAKASSKYIKSPILYYGQSHYKRPGLLRFSGLETPYSLHLNLMKDTLVSCPPIQRWDIIYPIIVDQGVVLTLDGFAISETLADYSRTFENDNLIIDSEFIYLKSVPQESTEIYGHLLKKKGQTNYGHWLVELLIRHFFLHTILGISMPCIIHKAIPLFIKNMYFDSLGVFSNTDVYQVGYSPILVKEITTLTGFSKHPDLKSTFIRAMSSYFRNKFGGFNTKNALKTYVTRSPKHRRVITNESEVKQFFRSHDFEIVEPESLSFHEQVKVFSATSELYGIMGAAMCNSIWCDVNTKIGYIASAAMNGRFYLDMESIIGRNSFNYLSCKVAGIREPLHDDIIVEMSELREWYFRISRGG